MDCAASTYSSERCVEHQAARQPGEFRPPHHQHGDTVLRVPMPSAAAIAIARMIGGKQNTRSVSAHQDLLGPAARIGGDGAEQGAEQRRRSAPR